MITYGMVERGRQHAREPRLEPPRQPAVMSSLDRCGVRQERVKHSAGVTTMATASDASSATM